MTPLPPKNPNEYREPNIDKARPLTIEFIRNKNFINKEKTIAEFSTMFDCDLNHAADLFDHLVLCDYLRKGRKSNNQYIVNQRALKKLDRLDDQQKEPQHAQLAHYLITTGTKQIELNDVRLQCIEYVKARRFINSRKLLAVFDDMFIDTHIAYGAIEFLKAVGFIELSTVRRSNFYINHSAIHKSRYKEVQPMPSDGLLSNAAQCVLKLPEVVTPTCVALLLMHELSLDRGLAKDTVLIMQQCELIKRLAPSMLRINHAAIEKFIDTPTPLSKYQQADIDNACESIAAKQPPTPHIKNAGEMAFIKKFLKPSTKEQTKEKHMTKAILTIAIGVFAIGILIGWGLS